MLAATAIGVFSTLAAITAPCSVNTSGSFRRPPQLELDVANCNFKSANSSAVSENAKSSGKRSMLMGREGIGSRAFSSLAQADRNSSSSGLSCMSRGPPRTSLNQRPQPSCPVPVLGVLSGGVVRHADDRSISSFCSSASTHFCSVASARLSILPVADHRASAFRNVPSSSSS